MGIGGIASGKYFIGYEAQRSDKSAAAKNFTSRMGERQDAGLLVQTQNKRNDKESAANTAMEAYLVSTSSVCHRLSVSSINNTETNRYTIEEMEGGYLRIYDKERKEGFNWKLDENQIQVDKESGKKFLINDWGSGFFNMVAVDEELENGIKDALGVEELEEKELTGFTLHNDGNTGVSYITANGYESRGGLIVFDAQANQRLNSLAQEYLDKYPNLVKTFNEAWFYATFEVRGLAKRTSEGIMMVSPNSISFRDKDGENRWTEIFDEQSWQSVKKEFDSSTGNIQAGKWNYWESLLKGKNINCSLIIPDTV